MHSNKFENNFESLIDKNRIKLFIEACLETKNIQKSS